MRFRTAFAFALLGALPCACGDKGSTLARPQISETTTELASSSRFCPDEYLHYKLRWKGVEGATFEFVSGKPGDLAGVPAIIVRSLSRTSGVAAMFKEVREELTTRVSLQSGTPISNYSDNTEGKAREYLRVSYRPDGYTASLTGDDGNEEWTEKAEGPQHDFHTLLGMLRSWEGEVGDTRFTYVQSARSYFHVKVTITGSESITTGIGKLPAIRIDGLATRLRQDGKEASKKAQAFTMWRSDDGRYLPLRFDVETRLGPVQGLLSEVRQLESAECIVVEPGKSSVPVPTSTLEDPKEALSEDKLPEEPSVEDPSPEEPEDGTKSAP